MDEIQVRVERYIYLEEIWKAMSNAGKNNGTQRSSPPREKCPSGILHTEDRKVLQLYSPQCVLNGLVQGGRANEEILKIKGTPGKGQHQYVLILQVS